MTMSCDLVSVEGNRNHKWKETGMMKLVHVTSTLQVATILVAMATRILELATKLECKSPARRLKLM